MKRSPYTIRTGHVKALKNFTLANQEFNKGGLYYYCFDDSTVCCPDTGKWVYVGLSYPHLFRKVNIFDLFILIGKSIVKKCSGI